MINDKVLTRFFERVIPVPESGCHIWMGSLFQDGRYGQVKVNPTKTMSTHRFAWIIANGPIPDGLCVLHRCDVMQCVNPEHLFLGTFKDNNADRAAKLRSFRPRGTKKTTAKLNDAKVAYLRSLPILRLHRAHELAAEWGVNYNHLYRVRAGRRWFSMRDPVPLPPQTS